MKRKLMRDKPASDQRLLARWYRHVDQVGKELARAAAPPRWWMRMWHGLRMVGADFWPWDAVPVVVPAPPSGQPRHEPRCAHERAELVTLGAAIKRPTVADRVLLGIEAMACPTCGMVVSVIR